MFKKLALWFCVFSLLFLFANTVFAVNVTGNVTYDGVPVCSMVLANGQYMFTCDSTDVGSFDLDVPLDANGEITVFTFCSGLAPYKQIITPDQGTGIQIHMLAGEAGTGMDVDYTIKAMNTTWALVEGTLTYNSVSICAMALANGQYMFSSSDDGSFSLLAPLDEMGSIRFFGFCDGLPPHETLFTTNEIDFHADYDHDGYTVAGGDTNDFNAAIYPGATEVYVDGESRSIQNRTYVTLGGSNSSDSDNDTLTYLWTLVQKPSVSSSELLQQNASEAVIFLDALGDFVFEMTVTDEDGLSSTEEVTISSITGPEYSLSDIVSDFSSRIINNFVEALAYGVEKSLSFFQVDYLMNADLGTSYNFVLNNQDSEEPEGGATFNDNDISFNLENVLEVPYNFSDINYPDDYDASNAKTVVTTDPICKPPKDKTLIPAEYMGNFTLPEIKVSDVGQSGIRMIRMKDVWDTRCPNYVFGCTGDVRVSFLQTLTRLKDMGANAVAFTPWHWFDGREDTWRVMSAEESNSVSMSDRELTWAVGEAKRQGFQTYWTAQVQGALVYDANNNETMLFGQTDDPNLVIKTFEALDAWFLERGEFLENIGVDGVLLNDWYWTGLSGVLDQASYVERMVSNFRNMRTHFTGKIATNSDSSLYESDEVADLIDFYYTSIWPWNRPSIDTLQTWTVDEFKAALFDNINSVRGANAPVLWGMGFPSRTNVFETGYVEETFCNESTSGIDGFSPGCVQKDMPTDFSIQAVYMEAALEALSDQMASTDFPESKGLMGQYWMDDNVIASTTFPNLAFSVRSKPAEYILYRWFKQ